LRGTSETINGFVQEAKIKELAEQSYSATVLPKTVTIFRIDNSLDNPSALSPSETRARELLYNGH
jgi:hypothetical protein